MDGPCGIITLLTDFGTQDGYVGAMKGVILGINPEARIVDIGHQVERHDLFQAALVLRNTCRYFPPGSVHVVVVDPGVGGSRKPLVVETANFFLVGPDNGVLSPVLEEFPPIKMVAIENKQYILSHVSDTFHGRDVFAPAAAHCSLGLPVEKFGPQMKTYRRMELPHPRVLTDGLCGQVIAVDRFGNLRQPLRLARCQTSPPQLRRSFLETFADQFRRSRFYMRVLCSYPFMSSAPVFSVHSFHCVKLSLYTPNPLECQTKV